MRKALLVILILAILPPASAQEGLRVLEHNLTYSLGEEDFYVEELLVIQNEGSAAGNLFRDNIYFSRGDASNVTVNVIGGETMYSVTSKPFTTIRINLTIWKNEIRQIILKYRRSDMLYKGENINFFNGEALGKYPWIVGKTSIKFKTPVGYQFGNLTPYIKRTIKGDQEEISQTILPLNVKDLKAIMDGVPVSIEYGKYRYLTEEEIKKVQNTFPDAEFDVEDANKSVENARAYGVPLDKILAAYSEASKMLEEARIQLQLAEIKKNPSYEQYSPYEAYNHAKNAREYTTEASRKATNAKNLANFETQAFLVDKISKLGTNLTEQAKKIDGIPTQTREVIIEKTRQNWTPFFAIFAILIIFAAVKLTRRREERVGTVKDFRVIDDLKRKSFVGFDKKVDTVKKGVEVATEIRKLRNEKEKFDLGAENLRKRMISGELTEKQYEVEREKIENRIKQISSQIYELEEKLKEIKQVKK